MLLVACSTRPSAQAQKLEQMVAGAKKEGEVTLIASASTFGGKKGFAELEASFNKSYGLTAKVNLAPAARAFRRWRPASSPSTKPAAKSSTDFILAPTARMASMDQEKCCKS